MSLKGFTIPNEGFSYNPVLKYPRNKECYCGSGLKFKKCCLPGEPLVIPTKLAIESDKLIKQLK